MGLDCYIKHDDCETDFTYEDDPRIKNVNLIGGMMSGNAPSAADMAKLSQQMGGGSMPSLPGLGSKPPFGGGLPGLGGIGGKKKK